MSTASGRQQGSEVLRNMGADECGEEHPQNTVKFLLGTRLGSELIGAEEAERAWPQLVRCAVPYTWCPISEDEDKRENISGEEASLRQNANSSTPSGDPSSGPKPRPERGLGPWKPSGSGRGAEAKTSVIRECIAKMWQSFGHMTEKSRKTSEGRRAERGCAAKLHEQKEIKHSEAPKFTDQYRSNRLKAIGCERALGSKGLGQPHQRADGAAHKAQQGPEVPTVHQGDNPGCGQMWCRSNVAELKSQAGERLGVPRIITKGLDEVSECRRCSGETAQRIKVLAKASALRLAWGLVTERKTCTATPESRPEYRCARAQGQERSTR
ncbi:hypothetical protein GGX14DRAFT_388214 [Mycena pura]|uniref:Uncharacterized protein n=1 Tax=Mycena pura TaxID=153505 RepID=A0AAD6YKY2_9AGAR|nr:hypothetical protein GGX14DRAFT_388214 [Mycena pura]